jgi:hypothetical protein
VAALVERLETRQLLNANANWGITPATVQTSSTTTFVISIQAKNGSPTAANKDNMVGFSANLVGFSSLSLPSGTSVLGSNGQQWTVSVSGTTLTATANNPGSTTVLGDQLRQNDTLAINVSATAPATAGNKAWTAQVTDVAGDPAASLPNQTVSVVASSVDTYTATMSPTTVTPGSLQIFTVALTNSPTTPSADRAQKVHLAIPQGFVFDSTFTVTATTSNNVGNGQTNGSWQADGTLFSNDEINLKNGAGTELNAGGTLTITFRATAATTGGNSTFGTFMTRTNEFLLTGPQPTVNSNTSTSTSVVSSLNPSIYGQSVTFTATVSNTSGSGGSPTGSVEFFDGATDLGTGTPLAGGASSFISTFTISTLSAGSHSITAVYTATGNFSNSTSSALSQTVSAKSLTVSGITAGNKVYNANTSATLNTGSAALVGVISGDTVTLNSGSATGTFASKDVGNGITVTVAGLTISGAQASDYTLTQPTTTANITPAPLTITAAASTKTYDGTISAAATPTVSGLLGSDTVTGLSETYDTKNAGTGKTLAVAGYTVNDGNSGGDYTVTTLTNTTGVINTAALTVTATGVNKVYDGTTNATVTLSDNRVSGDVFTDSDTGASFANKNVGTGKLVSVIGIAISGADAGNYTLQNTTASTTANITARALTVTATGVNKVYDGTTTATVTLADNKVSGDTVTDSSTGASFADKNAGTGKTVSVIGIAISGADAGNYALQNTTATTTANITARALTVTATGVNKVYDGTTTATVTLADNKVSGDTVTDSSTGASFADKNVGTGKTVSVIGIAISGADAGNYTLQNTTASTTANITARALTVTATGVNKVYDGMTNASVTLSDTRVSGDVFTDSDTGASFANKNAGTGKLVSVIGIAISGTDAGNYALQNTTATTTANITPAPLTITATSNTKTYDGTTSAAATPTVSGLLGSDTVTGLSETYDTKNAGTGKTLAVAGYTVNDGNSGGDYTVTTLTNTTGVVNQTPLTITASSASKPYGAPLPALTASFNGFVGGDTAASLTQQPILSTTATQSSPVQPGGYAITVSGAVDSNYTITYVGGTLTITPAVLTVAANNQTKTYGGTVPSLTYTISGFVNGDTSSVISGSPTLSTTATSSSPAGSSPITVDVSGLSAVNYTFAGQSGTLTINPAPLNVTANGQSMTYGGTVPTLTYSVSGLVNGDTAGSVLSGSLATKGSSSSHVGGYSITQGTLTAGANYSIHFSGATLTITPAPLTITANNASKVYGAALPALTVSSSGWVNGDTLASLTTPPTLSTTATAASHVQAGGYPITASGAVDPNYAITYLPGTLTVTPAPLTISADPQSMVLGAPLPALTASYLGFVNGDSPASLGTPASLTTPATPTSPIGTYPIFVAGASSTDYTITFHAGTLAIVAAASPTLTFTTSGGTAVAGQPLSFTVQVGPAGAGAGAAAGQVSFLLDGTPLGVATVDPVTGQATFATTALGHGTHTITAVYTSSSGSSTSSSVQEVVAAANTQPVLTAQSVRKRRGRITAVTLTAQVHVMAPGTGVPMGTVTYLVSSRQHKKHSHSASSLTFTTQALSNGAAVVVLKPKQVLNKTFTIRYSGDTNFNASTSPAVVITKTALTASVRPLTAFFSRGRQPVLPAVQSLPGLGTVAGSSHRGHGKGR